MPIQQLQTNFSSGELDPLMMFRVDTGAYQNGARSLRNGLLLSTGGVARRPGTLHLALLEGRSRILPSSSRPLNAMSWRSRMGGLTSIQRRARC